MAKKHSIRHAKRHESTHSAPSRSWLPENAYVGVVAIACLFAVALIVLRGPSLLQPLDATGEAYMAKTVLVETSVDHQPPVYVDESSSTPSPIAPSCIDPDGDDLFTAGAAEDATFTLPDKCVGHFAISEAICFDGVVNYAPDQACPDGMACQDGKCA